MNQIKKNINDTVFSGQPSYKEKLITKLDTYYPKLSKAREGDCNPLFFRPDDHKKHMKHTDITTNMFLTHMIEHHQVAIDMSKRLLLHTNHSYLMDFCNKLIIDQQGEIYYMNNLLKNNYVHTSSHLSI